MARALLLHVAGALLAASGCGDSTQDTPMGTAGTAGASAGRPGAGAPAGGGSGRGGNESGGSDRGGQGEGAAEPTPGGASSGGGGETSRAGADSNGGEGAWGGDGNSGGYGDCLVGVPEGDAAAGAAGAATAPLLAELGGACSAWGSLACAGHDQRLGLVCQLGTWQLLQECASSERCDSKSGRCQSVLPACAEHEPGFVYCDADSLLVCGPDRVDAESFQCCGACREGACQTPRCGDGQRAFGEECDDGNRRSGDGCDSDCKRSTVVELVAGREHTCALLREGRVRCWGGNQAGQLGLGDDDDHTGQHPYQLGLVGLGAPAVQLVAGSRHTCALLASGDVRCWGANELGQLGLGHTETIGDDELPSADHAAVALGGAAQQLTAGGESSCALLVGGTVRCWGRNDWGQLGVDGVGNIGDDELPSSFTVELGQQGAVALGESGEHLCVALADGSFRCFGDNAYEQLDFMNDWQLTGGGVVRMWGSGYRTYSLLDWDQGDFLFAAGFNLDGLLGVGGPSPPAAPSDAASLRTLYATLEVGVGPTHVCYLQADQTLHCFGLNDEGQLGLPDTTDRYRPTLVELGTDAQQNPLWAARVGAGEAHTCVWLHTRSLRCWGKNQFGQLGLGYASPAPQDHVGGSKSSNAATAMAVRLFDSD